MARILLVDDSELERHRISRLVSTLGKHECEFGSNGKEALEKLASDRTFDLILTDLYMPELDGLQLLDRVIAEYESIPVIVMTSRGNEETAVEALKRGAAYYVPKRSIKSNLPVALSRVLTTVQHERRLRQMMSRLATQQFTFRLDNNREHIPAFVQFLQQFLAGSYLFPKHEQIRITVAVQEALTNAMIHGNLEVSSATREGDEPSFENLIAQRLEDPQYASRVVTVSCTLLPAKIEFSITDEGAGFSPASIPDPTRPENLLKCSGRGLLMIQHFMDDVTYNSVGNQVTMTKYRRDPFTSE